VCEALAIPASGNQLQLAALRRAVPSWFQVENQLALARVHQANTGVRRQH
jgi:hypothetical protein